MKIIRFLDDKKHIRHGVLSDAVTSRARIIDGDIFGEHHLTDRTAPVKKLLAPIVPSSIFCIGLNYQKHAEESGAAIPKFPVLFMKGLNAIANPGDAIRLPRHLASEEVDYECELAIVIGKPCKNATRKNALEHVLGYTCANDISARDWQKQYGGGQWCRGKTFDTFCPIGPCIATRDEIENPNELQICTRINGQSMQDWNTGDMIFDVPALIEFLSGSTTLLPGTLILTGTPHGVGMARKPPRWLKAGDTVEIEIEKIGVLSNPVEDEKV